MPAPTTPPPPPHRRHASVACLSYVLLLFSLSVLEIKTVVAPRSFKGILSRANGYCQWVLSHCKAQATGSRPPFSSCVANCSVAMARVRTMWHASPLNSVVTVRCTVVPGFRRCSSRWRSHGLVNRVLLEEACAIAARCRRRARSDIQRYGALPSSTGLSDLCRLIRAPGNMLCADGARVATMDCSVSRSGVDSKKCRWHPSAGACSELVAGVRLPKHRPAL